MHPNEQPDAESPATKDHGPGGVADQEAIHRDAAVGINPQNTSSMPRAEDDDAVRAESPEFHDRLHR